MTDRIGIFICECGPNIRDTMDIPELVRFCGQLEAVVLAESVELLCAPDGQKRVAEDIRRHEITRVVFAGCSPREHEQTFRGVLDAAGRNPFMMQTVNIREQCAWVIHDRDQATRKAKRLIRGAVQRVRHHHPLDVKAIDCLPDVLVIGAGVAGISATRTLSQNGRRVFLVERAACIGGKVALYEDLYPDLNCAACLIEPDLDDVIHDDRVALLTASQVLSVRGNLGNFKVTVKQSARHVDPERCIGCAACFDACPVSVPNPFNAEMDTRKAVYIAYPGALPHVAVIDEQHCLRFKGQSCNACKIACPFDAIDYEAKETIWDLAVGAVVVATGFRSFDPGRSTRYGYGATSHIITAFAFERLVNATGPTGGKIVMTDGQVPDTVAFIHCVGSRNEAFNRFCSGVCCLSSFKHARQVKKQLPSTTIHHFFADLCLPGKPAQRFFDRVCGIDGVTLHRLKQPDSIQIIVEQGRAIVCYTNSIGAAHRVDAQLVVLATAMQAPAEAQQMARIVDIDLDDDGFFKAAHAVIDPVAATREGIYVVGCCQGPMDIPASVAQGQAAAGRILQRLVPGEKIVLEPIVARVDSNVCSGCRTCEAICPFDAIGWDEDEASATIEDTLCRGCGICAAACPSGAITVCHFSREAVYAEIAGLLKPDGD